MQSTRFNLDLHLPQHLTPLPAINGGREEVGKRWGRVGEEVEKRRGGGAVRGGCNALYTGEGDWVVI